jgi:putative SOS response-associated peptidase YedK
MCGRYMITTPLQAVADLFDARLVAAGPEGPRPNVSPTQSVPVVTAGEEGRRLVPMRWGFLPHWYKSPSDGPLLINARAETLAEKPAFRVAARERRCVIPADAFYEWQGEKGAKSPFVIRRRDGAMLALAGLWQDWTGTDGALPTCAIVTCDANATLAPIHHRMPVVLAPEDVALWLGEAGHGAATLMRPAPDDALVAQEADAPTRAILARRGG